ncbi:MAG: molybdenum cofactor guanylyltransferase [Candidatus Dormibacterales bacterium]
MEAALLVLAGGLSRRMGRPKPWLEVDDTYLLRYTAERLADAFAEVLVSFAEPEQMEQPVPYRVVFDRKASAGPLAGIEAGLMASRHEVVFVLACDMPYVTLEAAEMAVASARRCDAAIPRVDGRPEPVCGGYRTSALGVIKAALDYGHYRTAEVVEQLDVTWLENLDPAQFRSLNTPADLELFHVAHPPQR